MTKERTVEKMVDSLKDAARKANVSLKGMTYTNFNSFLDTLFGDGGETRCERFVDLAWPYANSTTKFGSDAFEQKVHECVKEACKLIEANPD